MTFTQFIFAAHDKLSDAEMYGDRTAARLAIFNAQSARHEARTRAQRMFAARMIERAERVLDVTSVTR